MLPEYFFDLDAPYVVPFSLEHILYLLACIGICYGVVCRRKTLAAHADSLRYCLLVIIVLQQISQYTWYLLVYEDPMKEALPLQMCRICSILNFLYFLTRNRKYIDLEFYFSAFALSAMIYPVGCYRLIHIDGISYMINHLMSLLTPILAITVFGWRPDWTSFRRAGLFFTVYLFAVTWVNRLTGGNYFYLVDPPFFQTMPKVPFYLMVYSVTIGCCALMTYLANQIENAIAVSQA